MDTTLSSVIRDERLWKKSASLVAIGNLKSTICNQIGVLAQLVERLNGIEEVRGSNPLGSSPFLTVL